MSFVYGLYCYANLNPKTLNISEQIKSSNLAVYDNFATRGKIARPRDKH